MKTPCRPSHVDPSLDITRVSVKYDMAHLTAKGNEYRYIALSLPNEMKKNWHCDNFSVHFESTTKSPSSHACTVGT